MNLKSGQIVIELIFNFILHTTFMFYCFAMLLFPSHTHTVNSANTAFAWCIQRVSMSRRQLINEWNCKIRSGMELNTVHDWPWSIYKIWKTHKYKMTGLFSPGRRDIPPAQPSTGFYMLPGILHLFFKAWGSKLIMLLKNIHSYYN